MAVSWPPGAACGRVWLCVGRMWPRVAACGRVLAASWPRVAACGRVWLRVAACWPRLGSVWPRLGRVLAANGRVWPHLGAWPRLERHTFYYYYYYNNNYRVSSCVPRAVQIMCMQYDVDQQHYTLVEVLLNVLTRKINEYTRLFCCFHLICV